MSFHTASWYPCYNLPFPNSVSLCYNLPKTHNGHSTHQAGYKFLSLHPGCCNDIPLQCLWCTLRLWYKTCPRHSVHRHNDHPHNPMAHRKARFLSLAYDNFHHDTPTCSNTPHYSGKTHPYLRCINIGTSMMAQASTWAAVADFMRTVFFARFRDTPKVDCRGRPVPNHRFQCATPNFFRGSVRGAPTKTYIFMFL